VSSARETISLTELPGKADRPRLRFCATDIESLYAADIDQVAAEPGLRNRSMGGIDVSVPMLLADAMAIVAACRNRLDFVGARPGFMDVWPWRQCSAYADNARIWYADTSPVDADRVGARIGICCDRIPNRGQRYVAA